jgi:hypothetical protein
MIACPGPMRHALSSVRCDHLNDAGDSMQADAALRILHSSFEPLIMDNDKDLIDMVVRSYVTPPEEETATDRGYDYSGTLSRCFGISASSVSHNSFEEAS